MISLTENGARTLLCDAAFAPSRPGFVGLEVDLLLATPGLPAPLAGTLAEANAPLRHGYLAARSSRVVVVSGPPSPGLDSAVARMADDLPLPLPLLAGHAIAVLSEAADDGRKLTDTAGVLIGLECGLDEDGVLGLRRRWTLAHALAPVLAAAFANSPLRRGRPTGWRSTRQALRRLPPVSADPRADWARIVLNTPVAGTTRTFREWTCAGDRPGISDLRQHLATVRPPIAARGHLEIDVADRQSGAGWRVPAAVISALLDEPRAAVQAMTATTALIGQTRLWERAARHGLGDPVLARAARSCFVAAYEGLARQGVSRHVRDAVATFTDRYVMRGRCPADDVLDRAAATR